MKKIFSAMNDKLNGVLWINAQEVAHKARHRLVEPIDILIALLQDPNSQSSQQLARFFPQGIIGVTKMATALLRETALPAIKKDNTNKRGKTERIPAEIAKLVDEHFSSEEETEFYLSLSGKSKKLLERAYADSLKRGDSYLGTSHVFMACIYTRELYGKLSRKIFLSDWRAHLSTLPLHSTLKQENEESDEDEIAISHFVTNISSLAKAGKLEPILGREKEMSTLISYLGRKKKNNVLLLGEPGVGKTALIEGLAQQILRDDNPRWIQKKRILSLDVAGLVAGTRYRGDFEERFKIVLREINTDPNTIVFIDEIHMIMGAGSGEGGSIDIANMLKPMLARSGMQLIGATTLSEHKLHIEQDKALTRRFQLLPLGEPSEEECMYILHNLLPSYESFHELSYTDSALKAAIHLSQIHIRSRKLPDKAIDMIDIASAQKKMQGRDDVVTKEDIKRTLETILKISPYLESHPLDQAGARFKDLYERLNSQVLGQENLIGQITEKLAHATLLPPTGGRRPFLSCLLVGEQGVGKTFLTQSLAHILWNKNPDQIFSFNLADFSEAASVSRLVGMPLGFTGYKEGGELTEAIKNFPNAVLVFENVDKAHVAILQTLLRILKEGELSDNKGQVVSFSYSLLFFTVTTGSLSTLPPIGFSAGMGEKVTTSAIKKMMNRHLPLEFLDNLDLLGFLLPLDNKKSKELIGKQIEQIRQELYSKGLELTLSSEALEHMAHLWSQTKGEFKNIRAFLYESFEKDLAQVIFAHTPAKGIEIIVQIVHNSLEFSTIH